VMNSEVTCGGIACRRCNRAIGSQPFYVVQNPFENILGHRVGDRTTTCAYGIGPICRGCKRAIENESSSNEREQESE